MAIVFIKELTQATPLSAYNNQITKFVTNTPGEVPIRCTIIAQGIPLVITPDPSGIFEYNFGQVFKQLVNSNHYQDRILEAGSQLPGVDPPQVRYTDSYAYKQVSTTFTIEMVSGNTETAERNYQALRSVVQNEDHKRGLLHSLSPEVHILQPFLAGDIQQYYATYWDGYPFDIAIYSNAARILTITHEGNQETYEVQLQRGVNRLFLSVGDENIGTLGLLPTVYGLNELTLTWPITVVGQEIQSLTLWLEKKPQTCGRYLKWFTEAGGWAYYLFQFQEGTREGKLQGEVGLNFDSLGSTHEPESATGIDYQEVETFFAPQLKVEEKKLVDTLANSPKIYEYLQDTFQRHTTYSWISANLKSNSLKTLRRGLETYDARIAIQKAQRNTFKT